jgi:hypothetical protein
LFKFYGTGAQPFPDIFCITQVAAINQSLLLL